MKRFMGEMHLFWTNMELNWIFCALCRYLVYSKGEEWTLNQENLDRRQTEHEIVFHQTARKRQTCLLDQTWWMDSLWCCSAMTQSSRYLEHYSPWWCCWLPTKVLKKDKWAQRPSGWWTRRRCLTLTASFVCVNFPPQLVKKLIIHLLHCHIYSIRNMNLEAY